MAEPPGRGSSILLWRTDTHRSQTAPERILALGIVHVPRDTGRSPISRSGENLLLGAYTRIGQAGVSEDMRRVLELFPVLAARLALPANQLSGGEQQVAAIGRALMARPRLLLIDEPSLGLAPIAVQALMGVVDRLEGTGLLLVGQDVVVALRRADRGYVIETGRVVLEDTAQALLDSPRIRGAYLGLATG